MNKNVLKKLALVLAGTVLVFGTVLTATAGNGGECQHSYHTAAISGGTVTLQCEHCKETKQVQFADYINQDYAPLDVVEDGVVNAKDYAYIVKHYNEFGAVNGFEEGTTDWEGPTVDLDF